MNCYNNVIIVFKIMSPSHSGQYDLPQYRRDHYCGFCNQNVRIVENSSFHRLDHLVEVII